jgi:hypothetical protein
MKSFQVENYSILMPELNKLAYVVETSVGLDRIF